MRKLIVTEFYSLDGLMSDPEDQMDWVTTTFSQDMGKYVEDVYAHADTLFLGEVTYQIMANYWPTADTNPEEIKKMKQEPGKNMLVAGSASIVQQLTHFGLVD